MPLWIGSLLVGAFVWQAPTTSQAGSQPTPSTFTQPAPSTRSQSTPPTTAPSTSSASTQSSVAELIAALGGADVVARGQAEAALLELDVDPLEALQAARQEVTDPDVQLRLDSLIVQLTERAAVNASRITLKFNDAPLKDVIDELARQTKGTFSDPIQEFGNQPPRVTIDIENVSFWKALVELQTSAGVTFMPNGDTWRVMQNFNNAMFSNGTEAGAFLIQPIQANYSRNVAYTRQAGSAESFSITLQMMTEPKIRLAPAAGQFQITRAVDSNGNNLIGPNSVQQLNGGNGSVVHFSTQLNYPDNPGERISELSGTLKFSMARRVETITVDDVTATGRVTERKVGNATLTITPAEPDGGQENWVGVHFVIETGGDMALQQRIQQSLTMARITDAQDRPYQRNTVNQLASTRDRYEIKITFMPTRSDQTGGPYRLTIDIPESFRDLQVPFTLRDLKMP